MRVPLTARDFLDRAELVYGDRVAVVDEPEQPAPSLGEVTYREVARRGRAFQAGLDELGIGEGGAWRSSATTPPGCWSCCSPSPPPGGGPGPSTFRPPPRGAPSSAG